SEIAPWRLRCPPPCRQPTMPPAVHRRARGEAPLRIRTRGERAPPDGLHSPQRPAAVGGTLMSIATQPRNLPADDRPLEVVVISPSPLFYWWPVWAVGFVMALLTYLHGYQVAFVPAGTVAERGARVEGHDGPRDILIAPTGQTLPADDPDGLR